MSEFNTPHYMQPYYESRIAELEQQLKTARAELARLAIQPEPPKVDWVDSEEFDPL